MTHLSDDILRPYLDHELADAERTRAERHLAECADCREALRLLSASAAEVQARLAVLSPAPSEMPRPAQAAFAQFNRKEKTTMLQSLQSKRLRPVWAGLTIVVVLAVLLSFAPVRALAGNFLGIFRVQQVTVLPVDTTQLKNLTGNSPLTAEISRLFSDSVTITKKPADPQPVADAAEAGKLAQFTVRLPASESSAPQLTVQGSLAFQFVVDRQRAQAVIDEAGYRNLKLPDSLDGATVKVDVPAAVTAEYGNCPTQTPEAAKRSGPNGRLYADCVAFVQIPSPTVTTPPDVDVEQLAEMGLQMTGMTPNQAHDYSQNVNWASTLVIPIPSNAATYKQVPVDGVTGTLIQRPADDAPSYALVWVKDGVIYGIAALGSDSNRALAMGNSLK
jgi:hypothetical protein